MKLKELVYLCCWGEVGTLVVVINTKRPSIDVNGLSLPSKEGSPSSTTGGDCDSRGQCFSNGRKPGLMQPRHGDKVGGLLISRTTASSVHGQSERHPRAVFFSSVCFKSFAPASSYVQLKALISSRIFRF